MRRTRRSRKTPCRKCRSNRKIGGLSWSTKARWQWKLRICNWLFHLYPITDFIVEDIKARTKPNNKSWNVSFSPLESGKNWFYAELGKYGNVRTKQGYETKALRDAVGLSKTKNKLSEVFEAHCVDSWVLANSCVGGHIKPDFIRILLVVPLRFHRRKLHYLQPSKGNVRRLYGGTRSLGLKRGSLVINKKYSLSYIGGTSNERLSLHNCFTGRRMTQRAKLSDCINLAYNSWRTHFPLMNSAEN